MVLSMRSNWAVWCARRRWVDGRVAAAKLRVPAAPEARRDKVDVSKGVKFGALTEHTPITGLWRVKCQGQSEAMNGDQVLLAIDNDAARASTHDQARGLLPNCSLKVSAGGVVKVIEGPRWKRDCQRT